MTGEASRRRCFVFDSRPPLPEKPARFRQRQLRKLLEGQIQPPPNKKWRGKAEVHHALLLWALEQFPYIPMLLRVVVAVVVVAAAAASLLLLFLQYTVLLCFIFCSNCFPFPPHLINSGPKHARPGDDADEGRPPLSRRKGKDEGGAQQDNV